MLVTVVNGDFIPPQHLQHSVVSLGAAKPGGGGAKRHTHTPAKRQAPDNLLIAARGFACCLNELVPVQHSKISVLNLDEQPLADLEFRLTNPVG